MDSVEIGAGAVDDAGDDFVGNGARFGAAAKPDASGESQRQATDGRAGKRFTPTDDDSDHGKQHGMQAGVWVEADVVSREQRTDGSEDTGEGKRDEAMSVHVVAEKGELHGVISEGAEAQANIRRAEHGAHA